MNAYSQGLQNLQLNHMQLQNLYHDNAIAAAAIQSVTFKPPPALPISTQFGEIIAYRFWMYYRGFLRSASHRYIWMPGIAAGLMEGQKLNDHAPCGVHAFKSQSDMLFEAYDGDVVFGTVKLWGDVIEYERGYHAEFASIVSLDHVDLPSLRKYQDKLMTELRARYIPIQEAK